MTAVTRTPLTNRVECDSEGWIAIRDADGHLWCEYHPERQVVRNYRKFDGEELYGEIAIDDLISGRHRVTTTRRRRRQK